MGHHEMTTHDDRTHALALAERLERQADLHSGWVWAKDHLTAAAAIRHLAGLPPRPVVKITIVAPVKKARRT